MIHFPFMFKSIFLIFIFFTGEKISVLMVVPNGKIALIVQGQMRRERGNGRNDFADQLLELSPLPFLQFGKVVILQAHQIPEDRRRGR